jgi:hypothetical protein
VHGPVFNVSNTMLIWYCTLLGRRFGVRELRLRVEGPRQSHGGEPGVLAEIWQAKCLIFELDHCLSMTKDV